MVNKFERFCCSLGQALGTRECVRQADEEDKTEYERRRKVSAQKKVEDKASVQTKARRVNKDEGERASVQTKVED